MDVALQAFLFVGGLAVALLASGRAVEYARALAAAIGAPAFVVGVVLVSIGTDLPELAVAVRSHLEGEGDVSVGTAVGSALVQYTFVVGLFPLVIAVLTVTRRQVVPVTLFTMAGLALTVIFVLDGRLTRIEGLALIGAWALFTFLVVRASPGLIPDEPPEVRYKGRFQQAGIVLIALGLVGFGATVAVRSLLNIAEDAGVPEFLIAFFGASIGTSAPEMVVDLTALRAGAPGIAFGDAFGSSLVDSTLTVGVGAVTAPTDVSVRLTVVGSLYSLVAVAVVGGMLAVRRVHDRKSGATFVALYLAAFAVLLSLGVAPEE